MTPDRSADTKAFLAEAGWGHADRALLAGDASPRRYDRLSRGAERAVLMDAPPDTGEDVRPFVAVTEWLQAHGLSAPALLASDPDRGFLLIEDLGDALFARHVVNQPTEEDTLYAAAVDLLGTLARQRPPDWLAPYDAAALLREARLLTEWYLPTAKPDPSSDRNRTYDALITDACADVATVATTVVLRDYHAENLIWLPQRSGHARVGLLDYQDALAGHPAYDLASLLEDARRDTSPELRAAMMSRYLDGWPAAEADAFRAAYATLGAQRNLKIVGIFARLALRDGKPGYLDLIPRVWSHLMRDLSAPHLGPLARWVHAHVPAPDPAVLERFRTGAAR